jgi:hypothetical protein
MSNEFVNISKSDLIRFAERIYSQGINGYLDLKESVCLSESQRFFDDLDKNKATTSINSYSNLTLTVPNLQQSPPNIGFNNWQPNNSIPNSPDSWVITSSSFSNPYYFTTSIPFSAGSNYSNGERQLTLFASNEEPYSSSDFESNEGHIPFNS